MRIFVEDLDDSPRTQYLLFTSPRTPMNFATASAADLDLSLATKAGKALLGDYANGAYSARNVTTMIRDAVARRIAAYENAPSPSEASGRGELPALRATLARAEKVLAILDPLCPPV